MKVALMSPAYWPEVRRGTERFAHELAGGLIAHGHAPRLITSHPGRTTRNVEDGLPVTRHWRPPQGRLRRRLYEPWLTHLPASYLDLVRGDDDLAHPLYPSDGAAAARWRRRTGKPVVLSYMGLPHRASLANRRLRVELTLQAVHGASAVVALSETARDWFHRWLGVEARVIAPGADLATFTPDPAARAPEPTILCAADAREPRKRIGLLLQAFEIVRHERPTARLVLSNPGPDGAPDAGLPAGAPPPPGVELRDLDATAALAAANREAWAAALPSWGEAFGLVLVEALACGTPVVGADREAIPEVVGHDDNIGRLFSGDDPKGLARALLEALELAQSPTTAAACRARAEQFSWDVTADAYAQLYAELTT